MQIKNELRYRATIIRFCDGDTVWIFLECKCCNGCSRERLRLPFIDSHEPKGSGKTLAAEIARDLTQRYCGKSGDLTARSIRRDIYGRIISDIIIEGSALTIQLINSGHSWPGVGTDEPAGHVRHNAAIRKQTN